MVTGKLYDFVLFNFLVKDKKNAEEVINAGRGFVIPGIIASEFDDIHAGARRVKEIKEVAELVSIGLGGGGNPEFAGRVVEIAALSNPGHINQPFERSSFARGYLEGIGNPQLVNALVVPSGHVGCIKLYSGLEMKVEDFVEMAKAMGIESVKFMPLKGITHLDELVYLTKIAAKNGLRGIEPAGGINHTNIKRVINAVKDIDIEFFMPHIFGSTIDKESGRTIPAEVKKILLALEGKPC
ncbi:oxo-acid lyase [Thermoactinomyces sp. AMNI-1]|uniref:Oxo-acid lyase n=1 Tax=Thermoactinomyces mirandus TaxID=2756294 RepID=A0A7W1XQL7_9BACL|nr:oxo-acid lyase [Thermoactinomyces mirandus]